ncbi:MAG: T9SS type A sorting domain-containing protein, partial [Candidatus Eisenbacteria sp.]|nr:T9SS type A sorting domain-containing protein [Candidatus Eisenbacteria bacterium]
QIKADMQYMYETYGVDIFYLGGDGNDHTMWTQQWPPPWDEIKEGYDELYPPEGEAHLNKIPVGEYIEDLDPQGYNTGYWTWWVATDDWYSDLYGDGSVYVTVSRSPFSTEEEALIETYKGMSYMDLTGYFYDLNVNEFIGDETYDNPHDGEQFVNNMNELREHFPPETYFQRLLQSDGDSWWRRDEVIDRYQYGSDANFFLGPNSSVNNKSSITWAPIFMWDMVGTCWPGMTFSPTCGQSNFCMTQRYEQQYSLSEDGLYDNFGGQVMYVGSTSGSWDDDLVAFYGFLLDRIFADRSIPIAVQVTLAKQDCRDAGINTLTIKSIVVLGPPWLTLNNEPHYSSVDEDPTEICLEIGRNYPNPFSSTTALSFTTTANGWVKLSVFDASGRLVRNLVNRTVEPGAHIIRWDGCNANGSTLPSGVYFSVLQAEGRSLKSMMLRVK